MIGEKKVESERTSEKDSRETKSRPPLKLIESSDSRSFKGKERERERSFAEQIPGYFFKKMCKKKTSARKNTDTKRGTKN